MKKQKNNEKNNEINNNKNNNLNSEQTNTTDNKPNEEKVEYIYLDNAASASESEFTVHDNFANPNSVHDAGRDGFKLMEEAREKILHAIGGSRPTEIIFTSGATEANNTAVFGIARAVAEERGFFDNYGVKDRNHLPKIITSAIEHESILAPLEEMANHGFELEILPVDRSGFVSPDALSQALNDRTVLVSIQHSNTEIGSVQDLAPLVKATHDAGAYFHCDAVGSFGRIPFDVSELDVDSAAFSGHKIGAPKGIGVLYLKAGTPLTPLVFGSGQEGAKRAGTQNAAGCVALGKAIDRSMADILSFSHRMAKLRNYLYEQMGGITGVRLTVPTAYKNIRFLPYICHILFEGATSEDVMIYMNKHGIEVGGGPACASKDKKTSHVLRAIGISDDDAKGAIRISFGFHTTRQEIDQLIETTIRFCAERGLK